MNVAPKGISMKRRLSTWASLVAAVLLTGCANMQSHNETANQMLAAGQQGNFKAALAQLDERHKSAEAKKELLYNMEKGELLRLAGELGPSNDAYLAADARVREWEDTVKTNPEKVFGVVGASLVSERIKVYEGQDYEKVWLTTRLALNRLSQANLDESRVDIKRTHEREALIAAFRSKETSAAEEEARSRGAQTEGRDISGYPVETLNDPEVLSLKNGYQNALSHYLAGFVYEALNEPGLAAPGYRKAIELRPGVKALEEGLRGLDSRTSFTWKRKQRMTDVLFVIEAGTAPARVPQSFTLPVPTGTSIRTVSISYPTIEPSRDPHLDSVNVAGQSLELSNVVDLNVMARRALKDEMPGMVLRGFTRAIAKGVMQEQLEKAAGPFAGLLGAVASAATEQADDRMWRMLPGRVYLARTHLPPGEHDVSVGGRSFGKTKIDGQYAIVPLRLYESQQLTSAVGTFGQLPLVAQAVAPEVAPAPAAVAKPVRRATQRRAAKPPVPKTNAAKSAATVQ